MDITSIRGGSADNSQETIAKYDLSKETPNGTLGIEAIDFTKASVSISTIGATGTSGNVPVSQAHSKTGKSFTFSPAKSLTVVNNDTVAVFDIEVTGSYLQLDLSSVTFGSVGRLEIKIILKR